MFYTEVQDAIARTRCGEAGLAEVRTSFDTLDDVVISSWHVSPVASLPGASGRGCSPHTLTVPGMIETCGEPFAAINCVCSLELVAATSSSRRHTSVKPLRHLAWRRVALRLDVAYVTTATRHWGRPERVASATAAGRGILTHLRDAYLRADHADVERAFLARKRMVS